MGLCGRVSLGSFCTVIGCCSDSKYIGEHELGHTHRHGLKCWILSDQSHDDDPIVAHSWFLLLHSHPSFFLLCARLCDFAVESRQVSVHHDWVLFGLHARNRWRHGGEEGGVEEVGVEEGQANGRAPSQERVQTFVQPKRTKRGPTNSEQETATGMHHVRTAMTRSSCEVHRPSNIQLVWSANRLKMPTLLSVDTQAVGWPRSVAPINTRANGNVRIDMVLSCSSVQACVMLRSEWIFSTLLRHFVRGQ